MKKEKITFDQLAIISYIKFTKLDGYDMTLLKENLHDVAEVSFEDDNDNYFILTNEVIMLEPKYIQKIYRNVDASLFESATETQAYKYLKNIDMLEFVLRKIKLIGEHNLAKESLSDDFSELQLRYIQKLYKLNYLIDKTEKNDEYDDYQTIEITQRGKLYLYIKKHSEEVNAFIQMLSNNNYRISLIDLFLMNQNLEAENILTLDNFIHFCNKFNINPLTTSETTKSYCKVKSKVK